MISLDTLRRIEYQLDRLEAEHQDDPSTQKHRERWLLAGFKPSGVDDTWRHEDGRVVTYMEVLATFPGDGR